VSQGLPEVRLKPGAHKRAVQGHPWIFSNEIAMDATARALEPGRQVRIAGANGTGFGTAFFNPHSLIAARLVSRDAGVMLDRKELERRLVAAAALRDRLFDVPHYRLVHAEADGLPGCAIDRYGDIAVCQINSAGMDRLADDLAQALMAEIGVTSVVLRGDSPVRKLEGLDESFRVVGPEPDAIVSVLENGLAYNAAPVSGQKTGWFFDQRDNRAFMARLAKGATVLDVYSHTGGFGIACAAAGASRATMVDRSESGLELARAAAEANGVAGRCDFEAADAFAELGLLRDRGKQFDIVICDPPAFVRTKKDLGAGQKGYRKLTRLAARLVAPSGILAMASCSHHVDTQSFLFQVHRGLQDSERSGAMLRVTGAGPDHPIHPSLPQSAYLKFAALSLDREG